MFFWFALKFQQMNNIDKIRLECAYEIIELQKELIVSERKVIELLMRELNEKNILLSQHMAAAYENVAQLTRARAGDGNEPITAKSPSEPADPLAEDRSMIATVRFNCLQCKSTYSSQSNLNQHVRRVHNHECVSCSHCPKTFARRGILRKHIANKHRQISGQSNL